MIQRLSVREKYIENMVEYSRKQLKQVNAVYGGNASDAFGRRKNFIFS